MNSADSDGTYGSARPDGSLYAQYHIRCPCTTLTTFDSNRVQTSRNQSPALATQCCNVKNSALRVASSNCDISVNHLNGIDGNWQDSPEYENNQEVCSAEDPDDLPEAYEVLTMWQKILGFTPSFRFGPDRFIYVITNVSQLLSRVTCYVNSTLHTFT